MDRAIFAFTSVLITTGSWFASLADGRQIIPRYSWFPQFPHASPIRAMDQRVALAYA